MPGNKTWVWLLLVVLLIAAAFAFLEYLSYEKKNGTSELPYPPPQVSSPAPSAKPVFIPFSAPLQKIYSVPVKQHEVAPAQPFPHYTGKGGRIAIIIDDMGSSLQELKSLMAIGLPLTFSIIPGLPHGREIAETAHTNGYQVMLHLPMEPEGYPARRLERNGLLVANDADELQGKVTTYLTQVPHIKGANNHMGSRFTANREKMADVLGVLKASELFFVDSMTTPRSVAGAVAREMGIKTARRQVFLDNVQDVGAIRQQLLQLAAVSRRHGGAIGICHPHPATIKALRLTLPEMAKSGITFVSAGDMVN